jgi:hypothetical protein
MYLQNSLKLSLVVTEDTVVVALALPFAGGNPLHASTSLLVNLLQVIGFGNLASLKAAQG